MSSLKTTVNHTYGSRKRPSKAFTPSSPISTPSSSPAAPPRVDRPTKRSYSELTEENIAPLSPPLKKHKSHPPPKEKHKSKNNPKKSSQKTLTQLHFNIDQSILRTCSLCELSYTKGAPDDEALHRAHCMRVRQGMEWGRDEEKDRMRGGTSVVSEVESDVKLKSTKKRGRIICLPADASGKVGNKLSTLLQTINLSLSAPDLPPSVLQSSKAYLFLLPHETQTHRERIVGCVIAQRITTAMEIIPASSLNSNATPITRETTITVDPTTNLCCSPKPLPTPMGVSRLFVSSTHRRLGIAHALLNAASSTFIYGCTLNPLKGDVAFSQPTSMGQAVMKSWGCSRVYEE